MASLSDILNLDLGLGVRNRLNAIIKFYNAVVKSDSLFNVERIDASYVKDATPTTLKFLRDDGTWQTIILNLNLQQILANGENTGALYTIEFENPPVLVNATQARVMTVNHTQQLVPSSINIADIATKSFAEGLVVGLLDDRGSYNASTNLFPATGGSGISGSILKGDLWYISTGGTLGGITVTQGDTIRALVDTPAQTLANWSIIENNFNYVPENSANKQNSLNPDGTGVKLATVDAVIGGLDLKQNIAQNIQTITSSATPTLSTTDDILRITAQAQNATFSAPTGTPIDGKSYVIEINDNGTARTLAYNSIFNFGATAPAITTTTIGKKTVMCFVYLSTNNKYNHIGSLTDL